MRTYIYICMYVCRYLCIYVSMHVCMYYAYLYVYCIWCTSIFNLWTIWKIFMPAYVLTLPVCLSSSLPTWLSAYLPSLSYMLESGFNLWIMDGELSLCLTNCLNHWLHSYFLSACFHFSLPASLSAWITYLSGSISDCMSIFWPVSLCFCLSVSVYQNMNILTGQCMHIDECMAISNLIHRHLFVHASMYMLACCWQVKGNMNNVGGTKRNCWWIHYATYSQNMEATCEGKKDRKKKRR